MVFDYILDLFGISEKTAHLIFGIAGFLFALLVPYLIKARLKAGKISEEDYARRGWVVAFFYLVSFALIAIGLFSKSEPIAGTAPGEAPLEEHIWQQIEAAIPNLVRYKDDIEWIDLNVGEVIPLSYRYEQFGWEHELYLQVKLRDDARTPSMWRASGHVLHYFIGGSLNPGVVAQKTQSHHFLGVDPNPDSDVFLPVPALAIVDELQPGSPTAEETEPAPESPAQGKTALTISPDQFAAQFNVAAELFGIDSRISGNMEFSQGENGQTARHDFSETAILNLVRPDETSPLSGAVLGLLWRNDLEMLAGLQHFWTLVAALEPGMTDAAIQDFTQAVLGASGGSVYSKSGIEFKVQELNDQSIFVFAHMKK